MQDTQQTQIWKQTIGSDNYPCFTGSVVYKNTCADSNTFYSNSEVDYNEHDYDYADGRCKRCGAIAPLTQTDGVYHIVNEGQMFAFAQLVNGGEKDAKAVLTKDIDLAGKPWTTIAETDLYNNGYGTDNGYSGTFDGQGHTIKNLALQSSAAKNASCGLFGTVSGTVKNLSIDGVTLKDGGKDMRTGAIVGQLITSNGHIINCCVKNAEITPGDHVNGGIAGCAYEGTIENCFVYNSKVNGYTNNSINIRYGYIVGDTRGDNGTNDRFGIVRNCYTDGERSRSTQQGTIENCFNGIKAERFASGEIAYLLQGSQTEQVWGQKLGGKYDEADAFPILSSDAEHKVCRVVYPDKSTSYANANGKINLASSSDGFGWLIGDRWFADKAEVTITGDTVIEASDFSIAVSSDAVEAAATEKVITATSADDGGEEKTVAGGTLIYTVWVKVQGTSKRPVIEIRNSLGEAVYAKAEIKMADIKNSGANAGYYCVQIEQSELTEGGEVEFEITDGANTGSKTVKLN